MPPKLERSARQQWMAILARANAGDLAAFFPAGEIPQHVCVKAPETGTVMVEGRAGGTGSRFNLGEASVTRCAVRLGSGTLGFAYALGRDRRKAEIAAVIDGLLQEGDAALAKNVATLGAAQAAARDLASRKAAATKVDFFTMVRGE